MKKIFLSFFLIFFSVSRATVPEKVFSKIDYQMAEIVFTAKKISVKVNLQPVKLQLSPFLFEKTNYLMIPLRSLAEMMQYKVEWNQNTHIATFTKQSIIFTVNIYPQLEVRSNSEKPISFKALMKNNRILLDHESIGEILQIPYIFEKSSSEVTFYVNRSQINMKAPDFFLQDTQGKDFQLYKLLENKKTKYVVLNFYASRCPICSKALPDIEKLHEDYQDKGIVVIGVNTDTQNTEKLRDEVTAKYGLTYKIVQDKLSQTYDLYSVAGVPNLYIINSQGDIVQHRVGFDLDYFSFLRNFFDQSLGRDNKTRRCFYAFNFE
jgi:peroxiredoxin